MKTLFVINRNNLFHYRDEYDPTILLADVDIDISCDVCLRIIKERIPLKIEKTPIIICCVCNTILGKIEIITK